MTNDEAQILRNTWQKWGDTLRKLPKVELETTEAGYYHCTDCGTPVTAKELAEKLHPTEST